MELRVPLSLLSSDCYSHTTPAVWDTRLVAAVKYASESLLEPSQLSYVHNSVGIILLYKGHFLIRQPIQW